MNNKTFLQKIENLPVPILPTMVDFQSFVKMFCYSYFLLK